MRMFFCYCLAFLICALITAFICVLHELGHYAAARLLKVPVKRIGLSWKGLYLVRDAGEPWQNGLITLAGPLVNLLLGFVFYRTLFGGLNLLVALVSLTPFCGSDGQRLWNILK